MDNDKIISTPIKSVAAYARDKMAPPVSGHESRHAALKAHWETIAAVNTLDTLTETVKKAASAEGSRFASGVEQNAPWQNSYFGYLAAVCDALNVKAPSAKDMFPDDDKLQKLYDDAMAAYVGKHRPAVLDWRERQEGLAEIERTTSWRSIRLTDVERHMLRDGGALGCAQTLGELAGAMRHKPSLSQNSVTLSQVCKSFGWPTPSLDDLTMPREEAQRAYQTLILREEARKGQTASSAAALG